MEYGKGIISEDTNSRSKPKRKTGRVWFVLLLVIGTLVAMALSSYEGYFFTLNDIKSGHDKIVEITIGSKGATLHSLSETYITDINPNIGINMIMEKNNLNDENIIFHKGDIVKIPTIGNVH